MIHKLQSNFCFQRCVFEFYVSKQPSLDVLHYLQNIKMVSKYQNGLISQILRFFFQAVFFSALNKSKIVLKEKKVKVLILRGQHVTVKQTDKLVALGAHPLPPFLRQCSVFAEQKKVETAVDRITGIELATLQLTRPRTDRLSYVLESLKSKWSVNMDVLLIKAV